MSSANEEALIVGWGEAVDLPEWGLFGVKAKVDTGARTSALHVEKVQELDEGRKVRFHAVQHRGSSDHPFVVAEVVRRSRVRSSTGHLQERWVVRTRMRLGPIEREIEISLVSRRNMLTRMLVGRKALPKGTVVDPNRRYLHGRPRRPSKKKRTTGDS